MAIRLSKSHRRLRKLSDLEDIEEQITEEIDDEAEEPEIEINLNLRDIQIAVCKIFDMTHDETAKALVLPLHPNGVATTTVSQRIKLNRKWIESFVQWGKSLRRAITAEVQIMNADGLREAMAQELGQSWAIVKAAIMAGDTDLAWKHIEQVIGKAAQPHSMKGEVNVTHQLVWRTEQKLLSETRDVRDSDDLLASLPEGVVEAELVEQ